MRKMLLLSIWLFSVTRCQQSKIKISGEEGGLVHINCPYDSGYEKYPKYFYKGIYGKRKVVIKTTDKMCKRRTQKQKYDLCDDTKKRILHVTIYDLNLNDTETYWCETDAYGYDPKIEVELKVLKAPAPVKPQLHPLNPPTSTSVEAITVNQQQSARTTEIVNASGTAVWSTPCEDVHTVLPPLARKELYLGVVAAALLLGLLVVLYLRLRNHRRDTARIPVTDGSSDIIYATVTSHRGPQRSTCHPVTIQTQRTNPVFDSSISSCLQDSVSAPIINQHKNICSSSAERDQTTCEGDSQPRRQITSAVSSVVYAAVRHPNN